jgi:hypothetical protein
MCQCGSKEPLDIEGETLTLHSVDGQEFAMLDSLNGLLVT